MRTKLTPRIKKTLVKAISDGNYVKTACIHAGISEAVYYKWKKRGEDEIERIIIALENGDEVKVDPGERRYVEFVESVAKAEAGAEVDAVECIKDSMKEDWRAALAFLERRFPEKWGRRHVTLGFSDGDNGEVDLQSMFYAAMNEAHKADIPEEENEQE